MCHNNEIKSSTKCHKHQEKYSSIWYCLIKTTISNQMYIIKMKKNMRFSVQQERQFIPQYYE